MADESSFLLPLLRELTFGVDAWKKPVKVVSTGAITLTGLQTVDGVLLGAGDEVICVGQSSGAQNGIWVAAAGAWTRRFDATSSERLFAGVRVPVTHGSHAGEVYRLATTGKINVGITAQTWELDSQGGDEGAPTVTIIGSDDVAVTESPAGTFTLSLSQKAIRVHKYFTDTAPGVDTLEFPISEAIGPGWRFSSAKFTPSAGVEANATNYANLIVRIRTGSSGGDIGIAATGRTTPSGATSTGNWTAFQPVTIPNAEGVELIQFETDWCLTFEILKVGDTGITIPAGVLVVTMVPWDGEEE